MSDTELKGLVGSSWTSKSMRNSAFNFCDDRTVTSRVHEICLLTTTLLDMFFDVLLSNGNDGDLDKIIPALFTRSGLLFGPFNFQGRVSDYKEMIR